ncbi:VOC family protein [Microbacteriaceae bacterium VKM Ac-2855]|nr:VOC family protein [Microbacteriaceae bacterium VKM Ac-2855]
MPAILTPYLNFKGDAKAAGEFYQTVFGGELTASTFGDFGMPVGDDEKDLIMHSQLTTPSDFTLMLADTPSHMEYKPGTNFSVSLSGGPDSKDELTGYYDKLVDGGTATEPLATAPWGDTFGMAVDKFGISWLVNIAGQ